ncbi:LysR family transcriptional regulator [Aureimonas ureilytica]|uniref:LysR family transcriptional regulator n=1 Tax=Aureimonas ureilytica TaxID=401562 RepID=UPI00036F1D67|nr:LysR family transcriptional regulator [Aureimonas ureilytica]
MDDLNVIRVFLTAADAGSFARAAARLGLTRSAVAKAIGRLEAETGTRLFQRTTRVVSLTDEGHAFRVRCRQAIADLEGAVDDLASRRDEPQGILRMTLPDSFGRAKILPILNDFLRRWPKVAAEVSFSDRAADVLAEGYDLALRIGARDVEDELISRVVARYRLSVCGSPDYLSRHGEPGDVDSLQRHSCLQYVHRGRSLPWHFRGGREVSLPGGGRVRFDSGEALAQAACDGLGLCQLPDFLVGGAVAAGRLRRVLVDEEPEPAPVVALYPSRKYLTPKVRMFIEQVARSLP